MNSTQEDDSKFCYQISDDEFDEGDTGQDENEESLLEESNKSNGNARSPYERAWTTEATRALIHIRGPMEDRFTQGRHKRTTLWLYVTKQLHKMGHNYSAAKVQKKWHNILITYNKNIGKKYQTGYVHWEFFEEMFRYLQGKRAICDQSQTQIIQEETNQSYNSNGDWRTDNKSIKQDEFFENFQNDSKRVKYEDDDNDDHNELPLEITHENGTDNVSLGGIIDNTNTNTWWKEYFDKKLQTEKDKIQLQREMHRDLMNFNRMSLVQQEKIERIKIDAINNLTSTLQKLVEVKNKKC